MSLQEERIIQIRRRLTEVFCPESLTVLDESDHHIDHVNTTKGEKGHFFVCIVAKAFENKNLVDCHRMVYSALCDFMKSDIHALRIQAKSS
ncbi:BolA family transcriptional regulator [Coxiella endosymbiont of Amblyomma sculptum]|uniref:BolA family protein n=1 Tax=Coxiella endosymbiont of Amblyomma sculptum TaxID=2487929 RepID=UPI00132F215E|nr:BolA family protein [Coxiella endosymbiont of Amblyomma sculptum]QHG92561.1 BolA family transcriptional regulator [Coxiella endosymbiont of Amblyomma sculptum]